jgi:hypothetical protein
MKTLLGAIWLILLGLNGYTQTAYKDSIEAYIKTYVETHEVVKGEDRKDLRFYAADPRYGVIAAFEKIQNGSKCQPRAGSRRASGSTAPFASRSMIL